MKDKLLVASVAADAPRLAAEYGIGFEIDHYCTAMYMDEPYFAETSAQVAAELKEAGAQLLTFHAPFSELHPAAIDPRALQLAYDRLNEAFDLAYNKYGIKKMIVHSGYLPLVFFKEWHHEKSVTFWKKFMEGKPEDFMILIENVMDDEPYMMRAIAEEIDQPNIRLCLDIGHASAIDSKVSIAEWIKVMGPYTEHYHIHNNYRDHDYHLPIYEGSIDIKAALADIEKYSPTATITIESLDAESSLKWLKNEGYLK